MAEMMGVLQGIAYGIIGFAILVVVGIVIMVKLGDSVAQCDSASLDGTITYNATDRLCTNTTDTADPVGTPFTTADYINGQLGSSGLSGWIPAIIAVAVGALFLSYFMGRKR